MPDNNKWCVYMHTNKINGKKYIGITSRTPTKRWRKDGKGYKRHLHFWNAIQKYGWNNFRHEIILQNETFEFACKAERCLIKHYKSNNPKYGYNDTLGGEGKLLTEEQKNILSQQRKGENNPFYGKRHTEETKQTLRELNKNKKPSTKQLECLKFGRCAWSQDRREKLSSSRKGEGSPTSKLTEDDVINILKMIQNKEPYFKIRDKYGISSATISSIKHKQRWGHLFEQYPELYSNNAP